MKSFIAQDLLQMKDQLTSSLVGKEAEIEMSSNWTGDSKAYYGLIEYISVAQHEPSQPLAIGLITELGQHAVLPISKIKSLVLDEY